MVISSSMDTFRKAKIRLSGDDEVLKVRVSGELYVVYTGCMVVEKINISWRVKFERRFKS